jgi:hypothetical protein
MNLDANLHPTMEHVGAAGTASMFGSSHKFTVSQATMLIRCIMDSGGSISPALALQSNKQYAKFFIPTSMLNTLTADPTHPSFSITDCELGMSYIPSHEAIAAEH